MKMGQYQRIEIIILISKGIYILWKKQTRIKNFLLIKRSYLIKNYPKL